MNDSIPDQTSTTIASYALAIQKALEANGFDADDIFSAAGLDRKPSQDPLDRLTTAQVADLFKESVKRSGNPAFGLTVARFLHPSSVHALGYALLASSTLRDACERLVYYFRLASTNGRYRIEENENRFCLIVELTTEGVSPETIDAWSAFLVHVFRMIYQPDLSPLCVKLTRSCPPGYQEQYRRSFHVDVEFDAPYCEICLDSSVIDKPLMGGNREIASQHDKIIEDNIVALDKGDVITSAKRVILQFLPSENCTRERVASELAMSPSRLQQKLAEQGTNFQDLLSQIRESLAMNYIEQSRVSITEMSFLLGFSDTSSFTRAFRRWTGKSPRDYRRDLDLK